MFYYFKRASVTKMFGEEKRLQKLGLIFLRITIFVIYFKKYVKYFLTFMGRQSLELLGENFHGFSFYFNFKTFCIKIQFFLQFLESIISEKNHLLEKHPKTDISQMETVSLVRDIKSFMEVKDFSKINCSR